MITLTLYLEPREGMMRSMLGCAAATAVALAAAPLDAESQNRRIRVAVLDLENTTSVFSGENDFAKQASDQLVTALVQHSAVDVIERAELEALLREQDMSSMGGNDLAIAIGKIGTVDYLITGTISKLAFTTHSAFGVKYTEVESEVNLRLVNTATGRIENAVTGAGKKRGASFSGDDGKVLEYSPGVAEDALAPAIGDAAQKISSLSLQVVAGIERPTIVGSGQDNSMFISQGENFGVQVGQRFEVHRVVDAIVVNGEVVDELTRKVGIIEVRQVLSRSSVCAIVEGEAAVDDKLVPIGAHP